MCTPSRAAMFTGQPPQVNGVFDQMELSYVPSMPLHRPSMGTIMKELGYATAYFGKFELDRDLIFARYYAPDHFNTPMTLDEIYRNNDLELFDLREDPDELVNLALDRERNGALVLRMNALLNELMAAEVGVNDGAFLPPAVRPVEAGES